ncbi:MAG: LytTR family DNA-binding domain-containing protein [Croceibacterium sp.]
MNRAFPGSSGKSQFAKRADRFAKQASGWPAFPTLELSCLAACAIAIISGAFSTEALPLPQRALFWLLLMGWSLLKWRLWLSWSVSRGLNLWLAAVIGAVALNLPLPLEIAAILRIVGVEASLAHGETWAKALAISGVLSVGAAILRHGRIAAARRVEQARLGGPLVRAGLRPADIRAIKAEDHYCRAYLAGGSQRLVLCRFGDALGELAECDGLQVHRGSWIADEAVERAEREGRSWRLMACGDRFAVSASYVAVARARGWLNRR